jgi:2-polyprenyl-6-hydroxyphenyl methylase/3-demethylubiquinone-9 3-methyltransferase
MAKDLTAINNDIYDTYGSRWYTAFDDPVALLRAESKVKTPWITTHLKKQKASTVLDVGCGGGFLSNALAKENFSVTGIDLSAPSLEVARAFDHTQSVQYVRGNAYDLPFSESTFDAVTCMDFLEHIDCPEQVIRECARVLKPGGLFFFHTFNRNPVSWFVVIKLVEWLVKNTPPRMHVANLFIKPQELTTLCARNGLTVREMTGIRPVFSTIPIQNIFSGVIPESMRFELTPSLLLSYMGVAAKSA